MSRCLLPCVFVTLVAATAWTSPSLGAPQGTEFTYQGLLVQNGEPLNGTVNMTFKLWDAASGGSQIGPTLVLPVDCADGLFMEPLDFGVSPWTANQARWLEITVESTPLPRQKLTSTPHSLSTRGIIVDADGSVGIGTSTPDARLDVAFNSPTGSNKAVEFEFTGAGASSVEFFRNSTANGQQPRRFAVIGQNDFSSFASFQLGMLTDHSLGFVTNGVQRMTLDPSGNVGIGTPTPAQQLTLTGGIGFANQNATDKKLYSPTDGTLEWMTNDSAGTHALAVSHQGEQRVCLNTSGNSFLNGGNVGIGTPLPQARLHINPGIGSANLKLAASEIADNYDGTLRIRSGGNSVAFDGTDEVQIGSVITPGLARLQVRKQDGVVGTAILGVGTDQNDIGVKGDADAAGAHAIHGSSQNGFAGYFSGRVRVTTDLTVVGNVSKGGGSFKIDHPLDPKNKHLYHSFVESPEMMNIYNGLVALDARGSAVVEMPEWFEALNMDFRYQLTAIGAPGPNLYVAQEIENNSFAIAGGTPGLKVSWQVTGVRHDAYANAHRIRVEEEKPEGERGRYLHPDAFGVVQDDPAQDGVIVAPAGN